MKVLLINTSPHENGTTAGALNAAAEVLRKEGIETELIQIGTQGVRGCAACYSCRNTGRCVFDDDPVNRCIDALREADGLIVGAPIYYASPTGTAVSLMDRIFCAGGSAAAHKPAAAVTVARRAGTTAGLEVLNKYFSLAQMPVVSSTYWNVAFGNASEADAAKDAEGMQTMRNLALNMAWLLKCIEAGKQAGIPVPVSEKGSRTCMIR